MRRVIYVHGKESGPWGTKSLALEAVARRCGWDFQSPDLSGTRDPEQRIRLLLEAIPGREGALVLVGSSMGGYVAACASARLDPAALLLLAPAVYLPGYAAQDPRPVSGETVVVHGRDDEVVPPEHGWRLARRIGAEFHLLPDAHALARSLPFLEARFARLLADAVPANPLAALL